MGLGLYIAREIATAHGGDIAAKSDENETVFTVRLPRLQA
jgi:signal transduction histidine kinase